MSRAWVLLVLLHVLFGYRVHTPIEVLCDIVIMHEHIYLYFLYLYYRNQQQQTQQQYNKIDKLSKAL